MKRHCFVGFFGITRGLAWTIDSIERHVFAPLARAGFAQTHAAHFNLPARLHAPRSGEADTAFTLGDIGRLRLNRHLIEPQSEAAIADHLGPLLRVPQKGEADPDGATRRNALHQLHSLRQLSGLFETMQPDSYDMVILLRPDLRYLDALPVGQLLAQIGGGRHPPRHRLGRAVASVHRRFQAPADLVLPAWHKWGGVNDRLAICTPDAARIYMNRIDSLAAYCAQAGHFQTEHLLAHAVAGAGLQTADTWVRAERVRTDGRVDAKDVFGRKERMKWFIGQPKPGLLS